MSSTPSVSFDLHKLGWKAFEDLVACIFRDVMGQTFQSFPEGTDGGRDGAFHGEWSPQSGETMSGSFTVQCKHTSNSGKLLPKAVVNGELPKVTRLATQELTDVYILVTNHRVTAKRTAQAEKAFMESGAKFAKVYDSKWINTTIEERPTLRRLVPRLYGLGDLTQVVTNQAYRQAREVLDSLIPDLDCFVPTEAYRKCAHAIKKHGFVLLVGEPASGKTMIANLLALSAADEWDLQTLMLAGPEEFSQFWNPDDPGQFLWVDDAFGANQYDPARVREWNHRLPKLKAAIHKGARVVFTTRDYIFNSAKKALKTSSFELFEDSRVIIEVEGITKLERQMILYNHLKCGKQNIDFRKAVKPYLVNAASTPKFLPEIARRFATPKFTKKIRPTIDSVCNFFEKPMDWLEGVLSGLVAADNAAIALVFITGGRLPIPIPEEEAVLKTIATLSSNIGDVKAGLMALDGSLLRRLTENGQEYWSFRHPTIRDAFASLIGFNPELIDIYLAGVTTEQLMKEITCGDTNLEGVKIIIPSDRYGMVLERLRNLKPKQRLCFSPLGSFLAHRCSGNFLQKYFSDVEDIDKLPPQIWTLESYDAPLCILRRLHEDELLPESIREATVECIYAVSTKKHSSNFMDEHLVGGLLTSQEINNQLATLKNHIFSNNDEIIADISSSWDGDEDPDYLFSDLEETLKVIDKQGDKEEKEVASMFLNKILDAVSEMEDSQPDKKEYETLEAEETSVESEPFVRSIFDDVDE